MRTLLLAALLLVFAVVPARADNKCTGAKLKAVGKKEAGLLGCQAKVAATGDSSGLSACEMKVRTKFSAAFTKAGACAGDETMCENVADGCESTVSTAMTDTFLSKCEASKRKAAGKLAKGELGCYSKAAAKSVPVDTVCVPKAQGKFSAALTKAGACPDGGSPQNLVESNCVQPAVATSPNGVVIDICPTTTIPTTSTTTTTTTTTTTIPSCTTGTFCGGAACGNTGFCVDHCDNGAVLETLCVTNDVGVFCMTDADCTATPEKPYCISNGNCASFNPGVPNPSCRALCPGQTTTTSATSTTTTTTLASNGSVCASGMQCTSSFCVGGTCCDSACTPTGDPCGPSGNCSGGFCHLASAGTVCAVGMCAGGVQTSASICDGSGNCDPGTMSSCSPYVCGANSCETSCASNADCAAGFTCSGGACQ